MRRVRRRVLGVVLRRLFVPLLLPVLAVGMALGLVVVVAVAATAGGGQGSGSPPSAQAAADIPPDYLAIYQQAATQESLDWAVLAAIGKIESNHGRSRSPGVRSGVNFAGCCAGPMQFNITNGPPSTWDAYGQGGNVYDPAQAIPAAARYLRASGAPGDYPRAIYAYNHADWYVRQVLTQAEQYRGAPQLAVGGSTAGVRAAQTAVTQLGVPYSWGGGDLDGPTTGVCGPAGCQALTTVGFDCSSLARFAWYRGAGVLLPRTTDQQWNAPGQRITALDGLQPGDLVFFGSDLGHVGIYLGGGQMVNAPATGDVVKVEPIGPGTRRAATFAGALRPQATT